MVLLLQNAVVLRLRYDMLVLAHCTEEGSIEVAKTEFTVFENHSISLIEQFCEWSELHAFSKHEKVFEFSRQKLHNFTDD